jgi:beta-glucosidase
MARNWKRMAACGVGMAALTSSSLALAGEVAANPWMAAPIVAQQQTASNDAAREAIANRRAKLLISAMTLEQKLQQLTGAKPETLPDLPECFGGRHVSGIAELNIPTFG